MPTRLALAAILAVLAAPALADFERVDRREEFASLIQGRELTRLGISLTVSLDGAISGSAFGQDVTGAWQWQDGFFCRDLAWGDREFGYNCQLVTRDGNALRFTSDRGTGRSADLYLR